MLLVEDNRADAVLFTKMLEASGGAIVIHHATTLEDGLEKLGMHDPSVVVLDLHLPDAHGWAGLETMRSRSDAAIVILTGTSNDALAAQALTLGAQDYLEKGWVEPRQLHRSLAFAAARHELTQSLQRQATLEEELQRARKLEAVGELAAGVAHELNTPIQYVSDNLSFVAEAAGEMVALASGLVALFGEVEQRPDHAVARARQLLEGPDLAYFAEELGPAVTEVKQGIDRMALVVRSMLTYASGGEGRLEPHDLSEALRATVEVGRVRWKYVAEVDLVIDAGLPPVTCRIGELNQVFLNLLVNASDAIAETHRADKGTISVEARRDNHEICIAVSDDGIGIADEHLPRIFDPFFTTKEVGKGTGQGLALAHHIVVERHGGRLTVASKPGRGARFEVRLPLGGPPR